MSIRSAFERGALLALAYTICGSAAGAVDVYDVTQVTLRWDDASGPVAGYYVYAARNGAAPTLQAVSTDTEAVVDGAVGDDVVVTVAAFDTAGTQGPTSPPSQSIRFLQTPPPPDDDPAPPPPDDDPAPDPSPAPTAGTADLDFNGDGLSDLLLRDRTGEVTVWNLDGSVVLSESAVASLTPSWTIVADGDFDGNGSADIVWQEEGTGQVVVALLAAGSVAGGYALDLPDLLPEDEWLVGGAGEFDGDGSDELFLFSRIVGESEILSLDAAGLTSRQRLPGYPHHFGVDVLGDLDGDGLDEVLWRDERRHDLVVWDLDGAGPDGATFVSNTVKGWRTVGSGDFDGNGVQDLFAVRAAPDKVQVWLMDAGSVIQVQSLPLSAGPEWFALSVGDHDGDGLSDLSWRNTATGEIEIWFSDGDGVTIAPVTGVVQSQPLTQNLVSGLQGTEDARFRARLCSGDFNGDGAIDAFDTPIFKSCADQVATGACAPADMDSDGLVGSRDLQLFATSLDLGSPCIQ